MFKKVTKFNQFSFPLSIAIKNDLLQKGDITAHILLYIVIKSNEFEYCHFAVLFVENQKKI